MALNYLRVISPELATLVESKNASDLSWQLVNGKHHKTDNNVPLYGNDPRPDQEIEQDLVDQWLKKPEITVSPLVSHAMASIRESARMFRDRNLVAPDQLSLKDIHDSNDDIQALWACQEIDDFVASEGISWGNSEKIALKSGVILIHGIGALQEIARLIAYAQPRVAIIFEPDLDLLALYGKDPSGAKSLAQSMCSASTKVFVISESDGTLAAHTAEALAGGINITSFAQISSFSFRPSHLKESVDKLICKSDKLAHILAYQGFFVDEANMLLNSLITYSHTDTRIITQKSARPCHDRHAVLVASGPSLQEAISHIREHRNKFDIFCCWSTLGVLLEAGIKPDYHCHMERHADHLLLATEPEAIKAVKDCYLLGSASIDPRLAALYRGAAVFLRSASACSAFLADDWDDIISSEGTQASNAALVMASLLGYRTIHLFGTDFGSSAPDQTTRMQSALFVTRRKFPIKVKGNHQKEAWSNEILIDAADWMGLYIELVNNTRLSGGDTKPLTVYNYSDGIRIDNTITAPLDKFSTLLSGELSAADIDNSLQDVGSCDPQRIRSKYLAYDYRRRINDYCDQAEVFMAQPFLEQSIECFTQLSERYLNSLSDQIIGRLFNGTLTRIWLILRSVDQQLLAESPEQQQRWRTKASSILSTCLQSVKSLAIETIDYYENIKGLKDFNLRSNLRRNYISR